MDQGSDTGPVPERSRFLLVLAWLMLAIVVTGFGRTFFFRAFFDVPDLPWYLYVHGLLLTSWFVLLVVQTSLVAAHRTDLHRRLGIAGVICAAAVLVTSLIANLTFPARVRADDLLLRTGTRLANIDQASGIFWPNFASLLLFSTFVTLSVLWRRRPELHKRLMLMGSIALLNPAILRLPPLPGAAALAGLLLVGLPLALVVYDILNRRRLHVATLWGVAAYFVVSISVILLVSGG